MDLARKTIRQARMGAAVIVAASLWSGTASADIIGFTGAINILGSEPVSVRRNQLTSDRAIFAFTEHSNLTLSHGLNVNVTDPGTYTSNAGLTPGTISAGTEVESYFLHTDAVHSGQLYDGSVTFSSNILGVILISSTLVASDSALGAASTAYPTTDGVRGAELVRNQDYVTLSGDLRTLTVHFNTHGNVDQVRVITALSVPEPSSLAIAGGGMVLLAMAARRRCK